VWHPPPSLSVGTIPARHRQALDVDRERASTGPLVVLSFSRARYRVLGLPLGERRTPPTDVQTSPPLTPMRPRAPAWPSSTTRPTAPPRPPTTCAGCVSRVSSNASPVATATRSPPTALDRLLLHPPGHSRRRPRTLGPRFDQLATRACETPWVSAPNACEHLPHSPEAVSPRMCLEQWLREQRLASNRPRP
jgi:hypothetical protein